MTDSELKIMTQEGLLLVAARHIDGASYEFPGFLEVVACGVHFAFGFSNGPLGYDYARAGEEGERNGGDEELEHVTNVEEVTDFVVHAVRRHTEANTRVVTLRRQILTETSVIVFSPDEADVAVRACNAVMTEGKGRRAKDRHGDIVIEIAGGSTGRTMTLKQPGREQQANAYENI